MGIRSHLELYFFTEGLFASQARLAIFFTQNTLYCVLSLFLARGGAVGGGAGPLVYPSFFVRISHPGPPSTRSLEIGELVLDLSGNDKTLSIG